MTKPSLPISPTHVEDLFRHHRAIVDLCAQQNDAKTAMQRADERTIELRAWRTEANKQFIACMEEALITLFGAELVEQYKFCVQSDWDRH